MSDISAISGYGTTVSLVDVLTDGKDGTELLQTSATAAKSQNLISSAAARKAANSAYAGGGAASSEGQAALKRAIAELQGKVDGTLTFAKIAAYQKELEEEFTTKVRADLLTRGVDPSVDFTLKLSPEGRLEALCGNAAARDAIETYLGDKPEVVEDFIYIQALANLERARQSPAVSLWQGLRDTKASIQAQAVEAFFSDALSSGMSYGSLTASFTGSGSGSSASFYAGINYTV